MEQVTERSQMSSADVAAKEHAIGGYIENDLDKNTPVYRPEIAMYASDIPDAYQSVQKQEATYSEWKS